MVVVPISNMFLNVYFYYDMVFYIDHIEKVVQLRPATHEIIIVSVGGHRAAANYGFYFICGNIQG